MSNKRNKNTQANGSDICFIDTLVMGRHFNKSQQLNYAAAE